MDEPLARAVDWHEATWTFTPLGYRPGRTPGTLVPGYPLGLPLVMAAARRVAGEVGPFLVGPALAALAVLAAYAIAARCARRTRWRHCRRAPGLEPDRAVPDGAADERRPGDGLVDAGRGLRDAADAMGLDRRGRARGPGGADAAEPRAARGPRGGRRSGVAAHGTRVVVRRPPARRLSRGRGPRRAGTGRPAASLVWLAAAERIRRHLRVLRPREHLAEHRRLHAASPRGGRPRVDARRRGAGHARHRASARAVGACGCAGEARRSRGCPRARRVSALRRVSRLGIASLPDAGPAAGIRGAGCHRLSGARPCAPAGSRCRPARVADAAGVAQRHPRRAAERLRAARLRGPLPDGGPVPRRVAAARHRDPHVAAERQRALLHRSADRPLGSAGRGPRHGDCPPARAGATPGAGRRGLGKARAAASAFPGATASLDWPPRAEAGQTTRVGVWDPADRSSLPAPIVTDHLP